MSRVLAVDPGEARIGLAVSDPSRTIARPLEILQHRSRSEDARRIVEIAHREQAGTIVVGVAYGSDGEVGAAARRGVRLAEALRLAGFVSVETVDESDSTRRATDLRPADSQIDARAAAVILQDYLDASASK